MATLVEIAEYVGCSVTSVSRVLNQPPGQYTKCSRETQERIREAARKLNYQPNLAASFLRRGLNSEIGLFLPPDRTNLLADMLRGFSEVANERSYALNLFFDLRAESFKNFIRHVYGKRNCGILSFVLATIDGESRKVLLDYLNQGGKMVVFNSGNPIPTFPELQNPPPVIQIDDVSGGRQGAEYLMRFAPQRLLTICGIPPRREGFRAAARQCGKEVEVFQETPEDIQKLLELISNSSETFGIFCGADRVAVQIHSGLLRRGIVPGERIHLVGYDDLYPLANLTPQLSSIAQPYYEVGKVAMLALINSIEGKTVKSQILEPRLIIRET